MLTFLDPLRDISIASIALRMVAAFLCGGLIGLEREFKRRTAGFRTHILICLGAAITTLTSQYLFLELHYATDMARLGAQVVAGIGFIGAGTILVTRRQRVKGLTTAAGLWAAAITGLCFGAGFYEGGVIATVLILVAELLFSLLEFKLLARIREINLYVECVEAAGLDRVIRLIAEEQIKLQSMEAMRVSGEGHGNTSAIMFLRLPVKYAAETLLLKLHEIDDVVVAEEL